MPAAAVNPRDNAIEIAIATPPTRGTGAEWSFRPPVGSSTNPNRAKIFLVSGVRMSAKRNELSPSHDTASSMSILEQ